LTVSRFPLRFRFPVFSRPQIFRRPCTNRCPQRMGPHHRRHPRAAQAARGRVRQGRHQGGRV
jgi:hypothetical protein